MMKGSFMRWFGLAIVVTCIGTSALAQTAVTDNLTPSVQPEHYRICNDRPGRPAWAEALPIREAWKGLTLRGLYELRAWEAIVATEDCSCETRFPAWDAADHEYRERFSARSQAEQTVIQLDLKRQSNELRPLVKAICQAQGNW